MSVFKSQFTRALSVIPSADCNIPFPAPIVSSVTTSLDAGSILIDNTVNFVDLNVKTGDIVYNNSLGLAATVLTVDNNEQITVNADIFTAPTCSYTIYQASPQTGLGNTGCYLMSDADVSVNVITVGGDDLTISLGKSIICGLQVLKLSAVLGEANVVALW